MHYILFFIYNTDLFCNTFFEIVLKIGKISQGCDDMDIQYTAIGKRIKLRRKELNIRQNDLAEKLNISNNHLSSVENGREKPSLELLLNICELLGTTPDYLLLGNMHTDDISQDILAGLRLCNEDDVYLARNIIELLIKRNSKHWNSKNSF